MKQTTIEVLGNYSKISGDVPVSEIKRVTSYPVDGHKFSLAFRKGQWDGRKHLYKRSSSLVPTGLIGIVKDVCVESGSTVTITDNSPDHYLLGNNSDLHNICMEGKYQYQADAVRTMLEKKRGIVKIATGGGKTPVACATIKYIGRKALYVVPNKELLYQTCTRFKDYLGVDESVVGMIGDGRWQEGSLVTVAIVDTLYSRLKEPKCQDLLEGTEVLFFDECHRAGADTYYAVAMKCPAVWRFGMSGTPYSRTDGATLRLVAAVGDKIVDISNKQLIESGVTARADIIFDTITEPTLPKKIAYATAYKEGVAENPLLLAHIVDWVKVFFAEGLRVVVLLETIKHGEAIDAALWNDTAGVFIPHTFIHGSESTEVRQSALADFAAGSLPVLVSSVILDEGVDVPTIDALILAGSRKSHIRTMQRIGRGLRGEKLIAVEFSNLCHKFLVKHSMDRLAAYRDEDCFGIYQSGPDQDLVHRLWNR